MSDWQPIETAPKDGTILFLLYDGCSPDVGRFSSEQTFEFGKLKRESHEWWGFRQTYRFIGDRPQPTHWMPIPTPPERAA